MVPPTSRKVPRVSRYSGSCLPSLPFAYGAFTLSRVPSQNTSAGPIRTLCSPLPHAARQHGLGWSPFARRYSGNRCFFLFLRLLRCFSSPGSLRTAMYSPHGTGSSFRWVSPFRHLRVSGYLLLTAAFRSLSRLSSALSAKASTLRSYKLDLSRQRLAYLRPRPDRFLGLKLNSLSSFRSCLENTSCFLGVAYPPNRFDHQITPECKHSSLFSLKSAWL